jgi:hypothetical protein
MAAAIHAVIGCSDDKGHAPFAGDTCTRPPCGVPSVIGGQSKGAGGTSGQDSGIVIDASSGSCFVEPTSGATLCKTTSLCTGFTLDSTLFPDCGFIGSASGLDLECVCQTQNALCPISVMSTCTIMMNQVAADVSEDNICNNMSGSFSTCRDLNSVAPTGMGGASNCNQACIQTCANAPACITGCCTNP